MKNRKHRQIQREAEVSNVHQGAAETVHAVGKRIDAGDHVQYLRQIRQTGTDAPDRKKIGITRKFMMS